MAETYSEHRNTEFFKLLDIFYKLWVIVRIGRTVGKENTVR